MTPANIWLECWYNSSGSNNSIGWQLCISLSAEKDDINCYPISDVDAKNLSARGVASRGIIYEPAATGKRP